MTDKLNISLTVDVIDQAAFVRTRAFDASALATRADDTTEISTQMYLEDGDTTGTLFHIVDPASVSFQSDNAPVYLSVFGGGELWFFPTFDSLGTVARGGLFSSTLLSPSLSGMYTVVVNKAAGAGTASTVKVFVTK